LLYLVPTPIGNLGDMTFRAVDILKNADLILAEDTRTSSVLLNHYGIHKQLSTYHKHNEHRVAAHLAEQMSAGKTIALLTDAGTPGISDPAYILIQECLKNNIEVQCLPGATAFVPALLNSGLPMNSFCFEGFLPLKKGRQTFFKRMALEERTMIFYESPMRLVRTLRDCIDYFGGERKCCVSRELTKKFEENKRGTLQEVYDHFNAKTVKGEIVLVVGGLSEK
jgi:16S rRNA (cytidine1402-2'-O)-methyltransferase